MTDAEKRIVETLAHAKDAAVVLEHIKLKPQTPEEAGAHAEIMAADASLDKAITTLKNLQAKVTDSKNP